MARDVFHMTIASPDPNDILVALEGVQVNVYLRGTTTRVTIYQRPTGATEGPTPESGATGGPNPFTTGPSGDVEFWVDGPTAIDVRIHDTVAPVRTPDRTFGWNATAVGLASIPTTMLAKDGGISLAGMSGDVMRQLHQIGEVIDWWRPAATVLIPAGFEVCDGRQIPAGQHDFPGLSAAAINLPDLRNMFILGADPTKAQAEGAGQGNASIDAPGIAGTGGSNAAKNFAHGHGVPGVDHTHYVGVPDHLHGVGGLYTGGHSHSVSVSGTTGDGNRSRGQVATGSVSEAVAFLAHQHAVASSGGTSGAGNVGVGGSTGAADRSLPVYSQGADRALATATNSTAWTNDPGTDLRPRFIGLLKLMKVRYS